MSDKTYHSDAGKGSYRRKEDKQKFEKNFDGIDWSVKVESIEEDSGCSTTVEVEKATEG